MTIKAQERERLNCPWCRKVMPMSRDMAKRECTGCGASARVMWGPKPGEKLKAVA